MAAGTGADEQALRLAERLERKRGELETRQREVEALEAQVRNWQVGAEGERLVAAELEALIGDGWRILHDVHWPGRPKANLDHVAVGPGGVLIIDTKNWSGSANVSNGVLWRGRYPQRRECDAITDMVARVAALLAPEHRGAVRGLLCLVQQDLPAILVTGGVVVVGRARLSSWCRSLPRRLSPAEVTQVGGHLATTLGASTSPAQWTTAHVPSTGGLAERGLARQRAPRRPVPAPAPINRPLRRPAVAPARQRRRAKPVGWLRAVVKLLVVLFLVSGFSSCMNAMSDAVGSSQSGTTIAPVVPAQAPAAP